MKFTNMSLDFTSIKDQNKQNKIQKHVGCWEMTSFMFICAKLILTHKETQDTYYWKNVVSKPDPSGNICFFVWPLSSASLSQSQNW